MTYSVVVVDKTGRGHSICDAFVTTAKATVAYLPGTAGAFAPEITAHPTVSDIPDIVDFCRQKQPDVVFVSHIDYLNAGLADQLRDAGLTVFGASSDATQLESSKAFCKDICVAKGVASPKAEMFTSRSALSDYLDDPENRPFMVKADWLTRNGNGAIAVTRESDAADILAEVDTVSAQNPGSPFAFLVEEFVDGYDYSSHFFVNDQSVLALPSSQDFKKSHDGDAGANCDGMASISPHSRDDAHINARVEAEILRPVLEGLRAKGISYVGPIYLGLRIDRDGNPNLIEINARMGDSESQTIFPRIAEDMTALLRALGDGEAINRPVETRQDMCMTLTLAAGRPRTLEDPSAATDQDWPYANQGSDEVVHYLPNLLTPDAMVHWANVKRGRGQSLLTAAGRIAHITARGATLSEVRRKVYASIDAVTFVGKRWRSDIASVS